MAVVRYLSADGVHQKNFLKNLENDKKQICICHGPAGTGKTALPISWALQQLSNKSYQRLILVRPLVEAGEKLGFLPGTLEEKVDPFMQGIYELINNVMGQGYMQRNAPKNIEIRPLAYMRGCTFDNSIILVDEVQNCTHEQIKMVLTRLGKNSKMILTGDDKQSDIGKSNGLSEIISKLQAIKAISINNFEKAKNQRNPIITEILEALE